MPLQFEDALAFLKQCKSSEGSTVFDNLASVLAKVLEDKPAGAIDLLETTLMPMAKKSGPVEVQQVPAPTSSAADAARSIATATLFGYPDMPVDEATGEAAEPEATGEFESEDIIADGALFDALGVGLGRAEMYAAMLAAKKLAGNSARGIASVRFFGKFFGLAANYYVFETTMNEPPEVPEAPEGQVPYEAAGSGANNYTYWVCHYLGGPFTQLPYLLPDQIKAARRVKKFLTGQLDAHVSTYPVFPGTEAHYLRAQITRIACSTVACPSNSFLVPEDATAIERNEEYEGIAGRDAGLPTQWAHRYPHLKQQGRCELFKREAPEEEEGEVSSFQFTEDELEEGPALLAALGSDAMLADGVTPAWTGLTSSIQAGVKFQVGGARSNLWPGAVCAAKGKHFSNLYVGWGIKNAPFCPLPPPALAPEFPGELAESTQLPPKPAPPGAEDQEEE